MSNKTKALELVDEIEEHVNDTNCLRREKLNECTQKLKSLLSTEDSEGVEVDLCDKRGEPSCGYQSCNCPNTSCDMYVTQSLKDDCHTENYCPYCGQKLIWPEQEQKEN